MTLVRPHMRDDNDREIVRPMNDVRRIPSRELCTRSKTQTKRAAAPKCLKHRVNPLEKIFSTELNAGCQFTVDNSRGQTMNRGAIALTRIVVALDYTGQIRALRRNAGRKPSLA
jgi:hypothetical protein